jgi:hypothetical protein
LRKYIDIVAGENAVTGGDEFIHRHRQCTLARIEPQRIPLCHQCTVQRGAGGDVADRYRAGRLGKRAVAAGTRLRRRADAQVGGGDGTAGGQQGSRFHDRPLLRLPGDAGRWRRHRLRGAPADRERDQGQHQGQRDQGGGGDAGQFEHATVSMEVARHITVSPGRAGQRQYCG